MFNVGNSVWVKAGRDKVRYGTIKSIADSNNTPRPYAVKIDDATVIYCSSDQIIDNTIEEIKELNSVAIKKDTGKNRLELIPPSALDGIGAAFTFGASKYADHNWAKGFDWSRLIGATLRHINAFNSGEDKDPESGLSHLHHAGACIAMLIAHETEKLGNDNRRKRNAND